ncbi:MAG: hypothetical protein QNJ97_22965 [Myxococcota bacterium]|nr:hypothetical protein [Myxococcota bacterium]
MITVRFLYVTVFAALLLLLETVLFHVVDFIFDYFAATSVISYAVLGIGFGAFVASRVNSKEEWVYLACSIGATLSLYLTCYIMMRFPSLPLIVATISILFFFPVLFISLMFRRYAADKIYLYDMAGAGLGVIATVILYEFLRSEGIILICLTLIPLLGIIRCVTAPQVAKQSRRAALVVLVPLALLGGVLFGLQVSRDTLNVVNLFTTNDYAKRKVYRLKEPERIARSYDSLIGRIDLLTYKNKPGHYAVCYNGYGNDHFRGKVHKEYPHYKKNKIEWPTADRRVFHGLTPEPKIFIIGSAARGITQTVKKITPVKNITAIEIDPGIIQIMSKDFYKQSGKAYRGLNPIRGNALSVFKGTDQTYDMITMINTHSGRTIGYRSGPDHLQTRENYHMYFDHLTEDGYILFEERPFNRGGMLGFYRMINTLWHTLKERGVEDPSHHFFVWDWAGIKGRFPEIDLTYKKDTQEFRHREGYYYGMIVTREPLIGERRERTLTWYRDVVAISRLAYLKGVAEVGELSDLFGWLESGDLSKLEEEGFDSSILTNDRPFASLSTHDVPEVADLVIALAAIFAVFGALCLGGTLHRADHKRGLALALYNVMIGFGYFFIEIMLLQVYQNVFVSPSMTLILVLGFLLVSSGVGGMFASRLRPASAAALLIPISLAAVYTPDAIQMLDLPFTIGKVLGVALICACGFMMGVFFPKGLMVAAGWHMRAKVPYLFAINSVAGALAVVLALYSGIKIGYSKTVVIALAIYAVSALMIQVLASRQPSKKTAS